MAFIPPRKLLVVVEKNLAPFLTSLQPYLDSLSFNHEVVYHDSAVYGSNGRPFALNLSSKAASILATNSVWPRVAAGVNHIFMIGELPCPVSGLNHCPDGHGGTFTFDGWRDSQNTAGAYNAMFRYGCPSLFWTDNQRASLSLKTGRMNDAQDGRMDNDWLPEKPKAAVGWVGGFGDAGFDTYGLARRAVVVNNYLRRRILPRPSIGAAYEFTPTSTDPHANAQWLADVSGVYLVETNARFTLIENKLYNRPTAFKLFYSGSSWLDPVWSQLTSTLCDIQFLRLSYNIECPSNQRNTLSRPLFDVTANGSSFGPMVVIPYYPGLSFNMTMFPAHASVGEIILDAAQRGGLIPVSLGLYGDPSYSL